MVLKESRRGPGTSPIPRNGLLLLVVYDTSNVLRLLDRTSCIMQAMEFRDLTLPTRQLLKHVHNGCKSFTITLSTRHASGI